MGMFCLAKDDTVEEQLGAARANLEILNRYCKDEKVLPVYLISFAIGQIEDALEAYEAEISHLPK